ncbi:hypothetical protein RFI_24322, partial [Reticulomyxa filosa]
NNNNNNNNNNKYWQYMLELNSYCLSRNVQGMLDLMQDIALRPNFEFLDRMSALLKDKTQADVQTLIENGETYALIHAASAFAHVLPSCGIEEMLDGISSLQFQSELVRRFSVANSDDNDNDNSKTDDLHKHAILTELMHLFQRLSTQLFQLQGPTRSLLVADEHFLSPFRQKDSKQQLGDVF